MTIQEIKQAADSVCGDFDVKRLDVFGSIATESATESSDVDLLVEFRNPATQPAKRFFGLLHCLEDALNCHVDLLTPGGLRNPYFRKRVMQERIPLYEG